MRLLCDKIQQKFVPQRNNGSLGNIEQYNVTGDNLLALKWCPPLVATVVACAHGSAQKTYVLGLQVLQEVIELCLF